MKIAQIKVKNFRLLKDFTIDLEDDLSLIIGKNNCGKTSFLSILERFLFQPDSASTFHFNDINLQHQQEIEAYIAGTKIVADDKEIRAKFKLGITLDLHIEYDDKDDLSNICESRVEVKI